MKLLRNEWSNIRRRTFLLIIGGAFAAFEGAAQEFSIDSLVTIFPQRHLVPAFIADGRGHRFSIAKSLEANQVLAGIGDFLPVAETVVLGRVTQLSVGASVQTTLQPEQSIAVMSTEFYVDFALLDIQWSENFLSRMGWGHTSHHLGDNVLDEKKAIDFSRDYVEGFLVIAPRRARIYAGGNYGFTVVIGHEVRRPWHVQTGAEGVLAQLGPGLIAYGAVDVTARQELQWGTTQRFQAGIEFKSDRNRLFRIALTRQSGLEERGQFFDRRRTFHTLGIVMEF